MLGDSHRQVRRDGRTSLVLLVPYDPDLGKALAELGEREFAAGRYNPVEPFPRFAGSASD